MKILIINWQCIKNPMGGGAEVHLHEIFKRIAAMGHNVTLFCSRFEGCKDNEEIDGIKIIRRGNRDTFNFVVRRSYFELFDDEYYDLVIDDINKIPFFTPMFVRKPLLAISHHFFGTSIFREAGLIKGAYVFLAEKMVNRVYKNTPFVVVSKSTLDEFLERGFDEKNFSIVHNAITQENFPMQVGEKYANPVVTYFGRLKKYKSVDHLLRAFALVSREIPNAELHLLGRGDFMDELRSLSSQLGIAHQTKFFGYISEEEKVKYLGLSHCVVNTSMKEGWGITNIEANACGTPVVSANVPGLKDSVSNHLSGLLYEYGDIEGLSAQIKSILTSNDLRLQLSNGAVSWAENFSWDESAKQMLEKCQKVYEEFHKDNI